MYQSKEIRWFERAPDNNILEWFREQNLSFAKIRPRVDFYLPKKDNYALGIKLREGNIEIKTRESLPELVKLAENVSGFTEIWNKWSFTADKSDPLSKEIIEEKNYDWVEVYKERLGVKIISDTEGKFEIRSIEEEFSSGCQMEYTRLIVQEKTWYSFAIESFGNPRFEIGDPFIRNILDDFILHAENSMGYPEMLFKLVLF